MVSLACVNVSSLAKRVTPLIDWGHAIYLSSEVRLSRSQQNSIARGLAGKGLSASFSPPAPTSPTFRVSPGGVGILAKEPWSIRTLWPSVEVSARKGHRLCLSL